MFHRTRASVASFIYVDFGFLLLMGFNGLYVVLILRHFWFLRHLCGFYSPVVFYRWSSFRFSTVECPRLILLIIRCRECLITTSFVYMKCLVEVQTGFSCYCLYSFTWFLCFIAITNHLYIAYIALIVSASEANMSSSSSHIYE